MRRAGVRLLTATLAILALSSALGGCGYPRASLDGAKSARFTSLISGKSRDASPAEVESLVEGYREADKVTDNWGTTHPVLTDITLGDGSTVRLWGGNPGRIGFQTVLLGERQFNIQGQRLHDLLSVVAVELE